MAVKSFRDLRIWQEAHALAVEIYKATSRFPADEKYALTSQVRRAATSIASNIAEGMGRRTTKDYVNFLYIARGSAQEVISHCLIARDLGFLGSDMAENVIRRYDGLTIGIQKCIAGLNRFAATAKQTKLNN